MIWIAIGFGLLFALWLIYALCVSAKREDRKIEDVMLYPEINAILKKEYIEVIKRGMEMNNDLVKGVKIMKKEEHFIEPCLLITSHFKYGEIVCPCCGMINEVWIGGINLVEEHMRRIERVRIRCGFKIVFNSGYRCHKHNREVGSTDGSMHRLFAGDARPEDFDLEKLTIMYDYIVEEGFSGIGRYYRQDPKSCFVHHDLRHLVGKKPYEWKVS